MSATIQRPELDITRFHGLVSVSQQMQDLYEQIEKAARSQTPVLIRGETGTGKELVARAIHRLSRRFRGPFKALNCATLTHEMLASELFGHVKGAFTGATRNRTGLFEQADGGTFFLDEVAELPLDLQARLLRVLEERKFTPLGGTQEISTDVRMLSATHNSLRDAVDDGRFRVDLMYRIRVIPIFLPSLAERVGDIEALTWHFLDIFRGRGLREVTEISVDAMDAMTGYDWPGNVRELKNVLEYACVMGEGPVLDLDELTPELRGEPPPCREDDEDDSPDDERSAIINALERAHGKKKRAADLLGVSRTTLWRKMKEHQIDW